MKIGLIGAGRIGKMHGEILSYYVPGVEVKTVSDVFTDGLAEWAESVNIPNVTNDYRDILKDDEIDAVVIASSTDTHARIIVEAAEAGKHILCEKPIDHDIRKITKALEAVKKAGVQLQIGFNRRFDHNFSAIRSGIVKGDVGDVHVVKITSRDPAAPPIEYVKVSGGIFLDMAIHDFDMARFLTGSEVEEVYASGAVLVDPKIGEAGDVDTAIINLKFKNGALGVIDNSRQAVYGYDQRVEVFGNKGMLIADNDYLNTTKLYNKESQYGEKPLYFFIERYYESYINEFKAFADALIKGKDVPVSGNDGLQPVLIGMAAQKSLEENRPVKISEIL